MAAVKLIGHIGGKHKKEGWDKARYLSTFADGGAENDFAFYRPPQEHRDRARAQVNKFNEEKKAEQARIAASEQTEQDPPSSHVNAMDLLAQGNKELLTPKERAFYEEFFQQVFQAVDRDEMQMPAISSLAFDMILVKQLRSDQFKSKGTNKELEDAIKKAEERIITQMNALGISRAAQLKNKVQIKSSPASIISGYLDEIEHMSPEALDTLRVEEQRVLARMQPRIEKMILANAPDLQKDEQETDDGSDPVLTLEEALRRANISV